MTGHISEELPRLLTGEASRDIVFDAAAHLRECADCQQELVSAVVAHASLTSAHRFAPEIVETDRSEAPFDSAGSLPDLSAVFAQVREEASSPVVRARQSVRRIPTRTLIGVAAAVAVIGTGVGTYAAVQGGSSSTGQNVALAAFQTGTTSGKATINGDSVTVNAQTLPKMAGKRYEVWLTNPQRTQMQPIGWVGTDGKATLSVPEDLISRYSDLEVSVQSLATPGYQYSDVSVLRGAYSD
jgi:hypothetical protein